MHHTLHVDDDDGAQVWVMGDLGAGLVSVRSKSLSIIGSTAGLYSFARAVLAEVESHERKRLLGTPEDAA